MSTVTITPVSGTGVLRDSVLTFTISADFSYVSYPYSNEITVYLRPSGGGQIGNTKLSITKLPQTFTVDLSQIDTGEYDRNRVADYYVTGSAYDGASSIGFGATYPAVDYQACTPPDYVALSAQSAAPNNEETLSWRGAGAGINNPITGYEIWRAESADGAYEYLSTTQTGEDYGQAQVNAPQENGKTYYFKVKTLGSVSGYDSELSDASAQLTCVYEVPDTPGNVRIGTGASAYAKAGETAVLSWDASQNADEYAVYEDGRQIAVTAQTNIEITASKAAGESQTYAVRARGEYAESALSEEAYLYIYSDPAAPETVLVNGNETAYAGEEEQVALSWSAGVGGAYNPIVEYIVYQNGEAYARTTQTTMTVPAASQKSVVLLMDEDGAALTDEESSALSALSEEAGQETVYTVAAVGERSTSSPSAGATVYTYSPVRAPTTLSLSAQTPEAGAQVTLEFSGAQAGEFNPIAGYKIYEDVGATGQYLHIGTVSTSATRAAYVFSATEQAATTCRYRVSTIGTYGESALSDAYAQYTTKASGACYPPTSVTITKNNAQAGGEATLYWSGEADGEKGKIVGYAVYRSQKSQTGYEKILETTEGFALVSASETPGDILYFRVQAIAQDAAYSSELSSAYAWLKTAAATGLGGNGVPASDAFHAAVKNGEKQRAVIHFYDDHLTLTGDDITAGGILYENYFCTEEDMQIGLTPSASASFSYFNDAHRLDGMRFGRFRASIGVRTAQGTYEQSGNVTAVSGADVITGHEEFPYVRVNASAVAQQPGFPIYAIFVKDGLVWCAGEDGRHVVYKTADGGYVMDENRRIPDIMIETAARYAQRRTGVTIGQDGTVTDYMGGRTETYTYVDLGEFYADRPARVKTNIVDVKGYDAMGKFDKTTEDMPIAFPITLYGLLGTVCAYVGVEHKVESFINQDIVLTEQNDIFQSVTAREIIGFIAEAAGANAKIEYDGKLTFAWWSDTLLEIGEEDYVSFVPYEYTVKPIDRLQIRSGEDDIGVLVGDGTNGYIIQENPFLTFESDAQGQTVAEPIYRQISGFPEYTPGDCEWFGDWSYRPGDVMTISYDGKAYLYPIFGYTMTWAGSARIRLESTGNEWREVLDEKSREEYAVGRRMLQISKSIDGVKIIASEAKQTSEGAVEKVAQLSLDVDGIRTQVSEVEEGQEELRTEISQTAEEIAAKVSKGEVIAAINLTAEEAKIHAPKISLEGIVTANENFKVLKDGSVEAKNGKFSGTLESGNWSFNQGGSVYQNGDQRVDMTILSGDFVGGGSGTRAFFGSSGMDVQYGADYDMNAYVRAGNVIIVAQNPEEMTQYGTARFLRSASGQMSIVCGESTGASTTDTNAKGNLGLADQYWDYTFTRVLRAGTYPGSSSRKIKQDIRTLCGMGDMLDRLEPVEFAYKNEPDKKRYGLIYEDAKEVMPVICFDDGQGDPGIVYTDLIAPLLCEIKELRKRVKALEERE